MPTVLYVGNFAAPASTENDVRQAFDALGWDVDTLQEAEFTRAFTDGSYGRVYDRALSADLVLHTMTQGSYPDPVAVLDLWAACTRSGIPTASIHLDLFYGLSSPKDSGPQRHELPRSHPMFKVAHVFTADGGHPELFARDGVNHHWLPPGVNHHQAIDVEPGPVTVTRHDGQERVVEPHQYLVGFAGSDGYHPEWPHRPALVEWLRATYGDRFLHIGGSSTRRVTGLDLNRVLANVPVWVGDSCLTAPTNAYWSDRIPETWGRGGFLIHPQVDALDAWYGMPHPGQEWETGDFGALRDEIETWLSLDVTRSSVRRRMAARTRTRDTYVQRVEYVLAVTGAERTPSSHDWDDWADLGDPVG